MALLGSVQLAHLLCPICVPWWRFQEIRRDWQPWSSSKCCCSNYRLARGRWGGSQRTWHQSPLLSPAHLYLSQAPWPFLHPKALLAFNHAEWWEPAAHKQSSDISDSMKLEFAIEHHDHSLFPKHKGGVGAPAGPPTEPLVKSQQSQGPHQSPTVDFYNSGL